jgi:hypothetical protein
MDEVYYYLFLIKNIPTDVIPSDISVIIRKEFCTLCFVHVVDVNKINVETLIRELFNYAKVTRIIWKHDAKTIPPLFPQKYILTEHKLMSIEQYDQDDKWMFHTDDESVAVEEQPMYITMDQCSIYGCSKIILQRKINLYDMIVLTNQLKLDSIFQIEHSKEQIEINLPTTAVELANAVHQLIPIKVTPDHIVQNLVWIKSVRRLRSGSVTDQIPYSTEDRLVFNVRCWALSGHSYDTEDMMEDRIEI